MAITKDDFARIWASTSPLTPYSFSDSNYQEGWNFIGSTPPARQMWDSIQKQNDEKMEYIVDNFLPLSGGTMTGAIVGNPLTLTADDGNDSADLVLDPSGSATWDGKEVERVNASGTGYIRFESGLQICWGSAASVTSSGKSVTYPVAFKGTDYIVISSTSGYLVAGDGVGYKTKTSTGCILTCASTAGPTVEYTAIGYWK